MSELANCQIKPSVEELKEWFVYDAGTGVLRWRQSPTRSVPKGCIAGTEDSKGRLRVAFNGKTHAVHHVCYAIHYGAWPKNQLDHANLIKTDNRIINLREATNQQNSFNRRGHSESGYKGVSLHKGTGKFHARITLSGKTTFLGEFASATEAASAYNDAAKRLHGEFALTNEV